MTRDATRDTTGDLTRDKTRDRVVILRSLRTWLVRLALLAIVVSLIVGWAWLSAHDTWLTYVIVASGPIERNVRLDASRLRYEIRRTTRSLNPVEKLSDAEGRFLTQSAVERCQKAKCSEMALVEADLADRPEFDGGAEVFKGTLTRPWRTDDIKIGDCAQAIPVGTQAQGTGGGGGTVVPNAGGASGASGTGGAGGAGGTGGGQASGGQANNVQPSPTESIDATELTVVGISPDTGPPSTTPSHAVFLVSPAAFDAARLRQFRSKGVLVTGIRPASPSHKPCGMR